MLNFGNRRYDRDLGVAYHEVVHRSGKMTADWVYRSRGNPLTFKFGTSRATGCFTLQDMALRSICKNVLSLTAECLENVPYHLGRMIWDKIRSLYVVKPSEVWGLI